MNKHRHSRCHYKRNSGSTPAGTNNTPHWRACGTTNSKRLTGNRSSSSDNDLRLERLDSCSYGFRANTAAEKPSPTKDENQPFKLKRRRSGVQAALAVSSAETTSSGCHHLSADGHLLTNATPANEVRSESAPAGPRSCPCHKNEYHPRGVRRVGRPPLTAGGAARIGGGGDPESSARAARAREPSARQLPSATGGERPSPQITEGRSGPLPTQRPTLAQLSLRLSKDDEDP
jgi:hypothetical protein